MSERRVPAGVVDASSSTRSEQRAWQRKVAAGRALRLGPSLYWDSAEDCPVEIVAAAVLARFPRGSAASHHLAAELQSMLGRRPREVHVTVRPSSSTFHTGAGLAVHRSDLLVADVCEWRDVLCTTPRRTAFDLMATLPRTDAVRWFEEQMRFGFLTPTDRSVLMTAAPGRRHARLVAERAGLAELLSESWLETHARLLLHDAGCPRPAVQHRVATRHGTVRLDLAWPDVLVVVELDGREFHRGDEAFENDRARQNDVQAQGWLVLRFTYKQVRDDPAGFVRQVVEALARRAR